MFNNKLKLILALLIVPFSVVLISAGTAAASVKSDTAVYVDISNTGNGKAYVQVSLQTYATKTSHCKVGNLKKKPSSGPTYLRRCDWNFTTNIKDAYKRIVRKIGLKKSGVRVKLYSGRKNFASFNKKYIVG